MEKQTDTFKIVDESGVVLEANLLTMIEQNKKRFAIYSVANKDDNYDILASEVIKDDEDQDKLQDITNPDDQKFINSFIDDLLKK